MNRLNIWSRWMNANSDKAQWTATRIHLSSLSSSSSELDLMKELTESALEPKAGNYLFKGKNKRHAGTISFNPLSREHRWLYTNKFDFLMNHFL